jgi:hypothetical protein
MKAVSGLHSAGHGFFQVEFEPSSRRETFEKLNSNPRLPYWAHHRPMNLSLQSHSGTNATLFTYNQTDLIIQLTATMVVLEGQIHRVKAIVTLSVVSFAAPRQLVKGHDHMSMKPA